ncbi:MAG: chemotaxis-specific protein-glutamate methyltransferase CheB [Nitrosomonadales bacterium]|nr:chemotaxis-specific protein-glutamate methyltransferase CheB [Nitrosomonadales bacterium]
MTPSPIKVLVVEDSAVAREMIVHILDAAPGIRVIGTASNGEEAFDAARQMRPDVITMDICMPGADGLETTLRIMEAHPAPIVIVSGSVSPHDVAMTFRATEAGALAALPLPTNAVAASELVQAVRLMSEVRVVRRWPKTRSKNPPAPPLENGLVRRAAAAEIRVVALGASTGGPPVLKTILSGLPGNFPAPVLVVQHMSAGFSAGFVEWLSQSSALPVRLAAHGEPLVSPQVYVAPDDYQMQVKNGGRIALARSSLENGMRPSVSCLFRSVAEVYGCHAAAGLLTGMGRDGADELKLLRESGAVTFAQDKESSVVHGMPGEAVRLDAAMFVLGPQEISPLLVKLAGGRK